MATQAARDEEERIDVEEECVSKPVLKKEASGPRKSYKSVEFSYDSDDPDRIVAAAIEAAAPPLSEPGDFIFVEHKCSKPCKNIPDTCHYHIVPVVFLVVFTCSVQVLACFGQDEPVSFEVILPRLYGNVPSWIAVLSIVTWAVIWLVIPSKKTFGPETFYAQKPEYQDNGFLYYIASVSTFAACQIYWPDLSPSIFWNMPWILASLNIVALVLCVYLFVEGLVMPEPHMNNEGLPFLFLFYRGVKLHPNIAGIIDVKQLTNCRIGLIGWQILITAFYVTGLQQYGFNAASFVNFSLQSVYLAKFFWWEPGYFWTLDIAFDHAGYYICWGCLVFVPALYAYSSYYLVLHEPRINLVAAIAIGTAGLLAVGMNFRVDYEKQAFQKHRNDPDFRLWGKRVNYIDANYRDIHGIVHRSKLLTTGCWGVARHLNYAFELLLALAWCATGYQYGVHTFLYFIFLCVLLVQRCYRDEKKCQEKYGPAYEDYCKIVPYRIIPYVF